MEYIEGLIEDAKQVIKKSRQNKLLEISKHIENYLVKLNIPIKETFREETYYIIVAYPYLNYLERARKLNLLIVDLSEKFNIPLDSLKQNYTIYNYITEIKYDQFLLLQLRNPFYPKENKLYTLDTYKSLSRFKSNTFKATKYVKELFDMDPRMINTNKLSSDLNSVVYIHPKYYLENLHKLLYDPSHEDNEAVLNEINTCWKRWIEIDNTFNRKINVNADQRSKNIGYAMLYKIDKYIVLADYDDSAIICIANYDKKDEIVDILRKDFDISDVVINSAKSLYDPRLVNLVIKVKGNIVMKIWLLLNYELIPYTPGKLRKAHPYVNLRLVLSEYLTYDILNIKTVANIKLQKYKDLLVEVKKLKDEGNLPDLSKCDYEGIYYPDDQYLNVLRIRDIAYRIEQAKKFNKKN